jgi:hypothetical protein
MKRFNYLLAIGSIIVSLSFGGGSGKIQTYSVVLNANEYQISETKNGYQEIGMQDFGMIGIPGKPALPSKTFMIALPPGADVVSIRADGAPQEIKGLYKVKPAPMQLPKDRYEEYIEKATKEYNDNLNTTYNSDELYPLEIAKHEGMGNLRKWRFAYIKFSPFQYRPYSGKLIFYNEIKITLIYTLPLKDSEEWQRIQRSLFDSTADEQAQKLFINYQDATKWYKPSAIKPKGGCLLGKYKENDAISYCIIIPDMSYLPSVTNYLFWKAVTLAPDTVACVSVDTIEAYYQGWDRVEKIRNFLIDAYYYLDLRYALLVGDIYDIPMRECWPDPNNHTPDPNERPVPTDYYYADLTGDWDSDWDGYYGEMGEDDVDFAAEISVGRIPWSNQQAVENICNRMGNFEMSTGAWKKQALMLGAVTFLYPRFTDEARIMEAIKDSLLVPQGWTYWRLYEKGGLEPSPLPCDDSLCEDNTVGYWAGNPFGYVNWSSHGNSDGAYRTINIGGQPENPPIFLTSDILYLNDNYPSIVFSSACLTAKPEDLNLGKLLLGYGSAGFIGGTRSVFGLTGEIGWNTGGNTSYNCYFALCMMRYLQKVGDAVYNSKLYYQANHYDTYTDQHNLFAFNLYGDPALIWQGYYTGIQEQPVSNISLNPSLYLFPNPARNRVTIRYNLPINSKVAIKIYNVSGRVVKTICSVDNEKAGTYTKYWNGTTDSGIKAGHGVYFCRIETDESSKSVKLTLLR